MKLYFLFYIIVISSFITGTITRQCNVCNEHSTVACVTKTTFRMCNIPGLKLECPQGLVCNSDSKQLCVNATKTLPSCWTCGKNLFACISDKEFAFCFDKTLQEPSQPLISGKCRDELVCDTSSRRYCVPLKAQPSKPTATAPTKTTPTDSTTTDLTTTDSTTTVPTKPTIPTKPTTIPTNPADPSTTIPTQPTDPLTTTTTKPADTPAVSTNTAPSTLTTTTSAPTETCCI